MMDFLSKCLEKLPCFSPEDIFEINGNSLYESHLTPSQADFIPLYAKISGSSSKLLTIDELVTTYSFKQLELQATKTNEFLHTIPVYVGKDPVIFHNLYYGFFREFVEFTDPSYENDLSLYIVRFCAYFLQFLQAPQQEKLKAAIIKFMQGHVCFNNFIHRYPDSLSRMPILVAAKSHILAHENSNFDPLNWWFWNDMKLLAKDLCVVLSLQQRTRNYRIFLRIKQKHYLDIYDKFFETIKVKGKKIFLDRGLEKDSVTMHDYLAWLKYESPYGWGIKMAILNRNLEMQWPWFYTLDYPPLAKDPRYSIASRMDTKTLRPINENDKWMTGSPVLNLHEYYYRFVKATNSFPSATEDLLLMVAEDSSSENPPLLFPTQIVVLIEQVIKDYNFLHKIKIFQTPKDFLLKYESKKEGLEILQRKSEHRQIYQGFINATANVGISSGSMENVGRRFSKIDIKTNKKERSNNSISINKSTQLDIPKGKAPTEVNSASI